MGKRDEETLKRFELFERIVQLRRYVRVAKPLSSGSGQIIQDITETKPSEKPGDGGFVETGAKTSGWYTSPRPFEYKEIAEELGISVKQVQRILCEFEPKKGSVRRIDESDPLQETLSGRESTWRTPEIEALVHDLFYKDGASYDNISRVIHEMSDDAPFVKPDTIRKYINASKRPKPSI